MYIYIYVCACVYAYMYTYISINKGLPCCLFARKCWLYPHEMYIHDPGKNPLFPSFIQLDFCTIHLVHPPFRWLPCVKKQSWLSGRKNTPFIDDFLRKRPPFPGVLYDFRWFSHDFRRFFPWCSTIFPLKAPFLPWGCPFQSFTKRSPEPGPAPRPRDIAPEVRCSLKVAIWRCGDAEISIIICIEYHMCILITV